MKLSEIAGFAIIGSIVALAWYAIKIVVVAVAYVVLMIIDRIEFTKK